MMEKKAANEALPAEMLIEMLREKGLHRMKYPVYYGYLEGKDICELDLQQRAYHCLRRQCIETIDQLADFINCTEDLYRIRNLGIKTAAEIMRKLYIYQYLAFPPERRESYLIKVAALNMPETGRA